MLLDRVQIPKAKTKRLLKMEKLCRWLSWSNRVEMVVVIVLATLAFATPGKEEIGEAHTYLRWLFYGLLILIYPVRMWLIREQRKKINRGLTIVKLPLSDRDGDYVEMGVYSGSWKTPSAICIFIGWYLYCSFAEVNSFWTGWGSVLIVVIGLPGAAWWEHMKKLMRNKNEESKEIYFCPYPSIRGFPLTDSPRKYARWAVVGVIFLSIAFFFDYIHAMKPFGSPDVTRQSCPLDRPPAPSVEKK